MILEECLSVFCFRTLEYESNNKSKVPNVITANTLVRPVKEYIIQDTKIIINWNTNPSASERPASFRLGLFIILDNWRPGMAI